MDTPGGRGGVVLRVDGVLRFVPAAVAVAVAPAPRVTAVPGAPPDLLGVALHEGAIVPVLAVGAGVRGPESAGARGAGAPPPGAALRGEMLVCRYAGELLGIVGGEAVRSGRFAPSGDDAVIVDGETVLPLDVAALYARVQRGGR